MSQSTLDDQFDKSQSTLDDQFDKFGQSLANYQPTETLVMTPNQVRLLWLMLKSNPERWETSAKRELVNNLLRLKQPKYKDDNNALSAE